MLKFKWPYGTDQEAGKLGFYWLEALFNAEYTENTVNSYFYHLCSFFSFCAEQKISPIDDDEYIIERFRAHLRSSTFHGKTVKGPPRPLSTATRKQRVTVVESFLDYTHKRQKLITKRKPRAHVQSKAAQKRNFLPPPSDTALKRFIKTAANESIRNRTMIALALDCGLRACELVSLHSSDINFKKLELTVDASRSKSRFTRTLPLSPESAKLLKQYLIYREEAHNSSRPQIFLSTSSRNFGLPIKRDAWIKICQRLSTESDCEEFSTHSFRKICLTALAQAGATDKQIARFAGHRQIASAQSYINFAEISMSEKTRSAFNSFRSHRLKDL